MVVICLGTGAAIEQESNDRSDIELPGHQGDLLKDAVAAGESRDRIEHHGPITIEYFFSAS